MADKPSPWQRIIAAALLLLAVAACSADMVRPVSNDEYRDWRYGRPRQVP